MTYCVQKRRGMNRRLAYQAGSFKNLRNKAMQEQTRKLKRQDGATSRDSEEEVTIEDLEATEEETHSYNSARSGGGQGSIAHSDHMMNTANGSFN